MHDELKGLVDLYFDRPALKRICEMHETDFESAYSMTKVAVAQEEPHDFYYFKDNGADLLAVAHLDTCVPHDKRLCNFIETAGGPIVYSGALDDRLGAYILLELLPTLGIKHDLLLTVGEESGRSTAAFFEPRDHHGRDYNWMIEFDRGGSDVVMYQYDDDETRGLVEACGADVGDGIFSDISYMEHLGIKGFNWGVGYRDYHSVNGHAYLDETTQMVAHYLRFHAFNEHISLPHEETSSSWWSGFSRWGGGDYRTTCDNCGHREVDIETDWCGECGTCNGCWVNTQEEDCTCSWAVYERDQRERAETLRKIEDVFVNEEVL